jgi:hypothetical protein
VALSGGHDEACILHRNDRSRSRPEARLIVPPFEIRSPFFALLLVVRGRLVARLEVARRKGTGTPLLPSTWLMDNVRLYVCVLRCVCLDSSWHLTGVVALQLITILRFDELMARAYPFVHSFICLFVCSLLQ